MKKIFIIIASIIFLLLGIMSLGLFKSENSKYLRLHIRANSNLQIDQSIKYEIKEEIINYLIPFIADCTSKQGCVDCVIERQDNLKGIADHILFTQGFSYSSKVKIEAQEFPEKAYGDFVLDEGVYDAVIIELGEAEGDNWWCVVYPPICFLNGNYSKNFEYKSRILQIINSVIGGKNEN